MNGPSNASAGDKPNCFIGHCKGQVQGMSPLIEFLLITSQLMGIQSIKVYILCFIPTCFRCIHLCLIHAVSCRLWDLGGLLSPGFPLCSDLKLVFVALSSNRDFQSFILTVSCCSYISWPVPTALQKYFPFQTHTWGQAEHHNQRDSRVPRL